MAIMRCRPGFFELFTDLGRLLVAPRAANILGFKMKMFLSQQLTRVALGVQFFAGRRGFFPCPHGRALSALAELEQDPGALRLRNFKLS